MQTVRDESKKLLMCNVLAFKVNVICAYRFIQVLQEIVELQKYCELLKKCIKEKEAPLKVAHTRLVTRVSRPGVEACKDSTQYRYITLSCVFFLLFYLFLLFCFPITDQYNYQYTGFTRCYHAKPVLFFSDRGFLRGRKITIVTNIRSGKS